MLNITYEPEMQNDFDDVRVYTGNCSFNGTKIWSELETKTDNDHAITWNKINLTTGNNTISIYYGNENSTPMWDYTGKVWNSDTVAVYLLNGSAKDSTVNQYNATLISATQNGSWFDFDGINQNISLGNIFNFVNQNISIFLWLKPYRNNTLEALINKYPGTSPAWELYKTTGNKGAFYFRNVTVNSPTYNGVNSLIMNSWNYIGGTYNADTGNESIYQSGYYYTYAYVGVLSVCPI